MTAGELFVSIRYDLQDMNAVRISDFELFNTLNSVLTMVNNALSRASGSMITKEVLLTMEDGSVGLPNDFQRVVSVTDLFGNIISCQIIGNRLHSSSDVKLLYKRSFLPIEKLTDELPLPYSFNELLKKFMERILTGSENKSEAGLFQMIYDDVYKLVARREHGALEIASPFKV